MYITTQNDRMSFQKMLDYRRELQIGSKYRILRRIGGGSFGDIYLGLNIANGEVSAASACYSFIIIFSTIPNSSIRCR